MADKPEPTVDSLNADIKRLQTERVNTVTAHESAVKRLTGDPRPSIEDMVKLAPLAGTDAHAASLKTIDGRIASATRARDYIVWETGPGAAVETAKDAMRQPIQNAIAPSVKSLRELGADHVEVVVAIDGDKLTTVINVVGAGMPKPPAKTAKRTTSNGGTWECDGLGSRAFVEAHLDELSAKTREHFNADNFRAFSMTREAERIAVKLGRTPTTK